MPIVFWLHLLLLELRRLVKGLNKVPRLSNTYPLKKELQDVSINVSSTTVFFHHRKKIFESGLGSDLEPFVLRICQYWGR